MVRVIIIGGGVSGLVCAHVMKKHSGVEVCVLEPGKLGGEFLIGGLKYIHYTEPMVELFGELDLLYSEYPIRGGILLRGEVHSYPKCLRDMDRKAAERIQMDHYRKTRRAEAGDHAKQAMNDPAAGDSRLAMRTYFPDMVERLAANTNIVNDGLRKVESNQIIMASGKRMVYDFLVLTIPLWVIRKMVDFYVPHGMAMNLNLATIIPRRDRYVRWDYVYTPYTPEDFIHRFSPKEGGYSVEGNGDLDKQKLYSDINFIFGDGWYMEPGSLKEGLKGHLLPLDSEPEWPDNIAPLGRFAKWDSRATTDVTLEDAGKLAERWFGG